MGKDVAGETMEKHRSRWNGKEQLDGITVRYIPAERDHNNSPADMCNQLLG